MTARHAPLTGADALRAAVPRLREAGIDDAARDARALLAHAMGIAPDRLTLHLHDDLTSQAEALFAAHVTARVTRRPVSQIIGERLFFGLKFLVTPDVLDPRPETEVLVRAALLEPFAKLLDLGTGSGAILLSCLQAMPAATGLGTDLSIAALRVAQSNANRLNLSARAKFRVADWYQGLQAQYDLIVSNPPYIAADEMLGLEPEVVNFEPHLALTPGGDGLNAYRAIIADASSHLHPGGRILLEIGPTQAAAVCALLSEKGFLQIGVLPDLDGRDRVVSARLSA